MKRTVAMIMSALLCAALCSCGEAEGSTVQTEATTTSQTTTAATTTTTTVEGLLVREELVYESKNFKMYFYGMDARTHNEYGWVIYPRKYKFDFMIENLTDDEIEIEFPNAVIIDGTRIYTSGLHIDEVVDAGAKIVRTVTVDERDLEKAHISSFDKIQFDHFKVTNNIWSRIDKSHKYNYSDAIVFTERPEITIKL